MFTALAMSIFDRLHDTVETASSLAAVLDTNSDATGLHVSDSTQRSS